MILRFEVDQAEAFRRGVNVPKSTNHVDVDPATLPADERNLIADRLTGIDVCKLNIHNGQTYKEPSAKLDSYVGHRIVANLPTYEALIEAVRKNDAEVRGAADLRRLFLILLDENPIKSTVDEAKWLADNKAKRLGPAAFLIYDDISLNEAHHKFCKLVPPSVFVCTFLAGETHYRPTDFVFDSFLKRPL